MAYQELSTEKYWRASAKSEIKQLKQAQSSQSVRSFNLFLVAYLLIMGCMYLMNNPDSMSSILTYVEQTGMLEKVQAFMPR